MYPTKERKNRPRILRLAVLCSLTVQNTALVLLLKYSYRDSAQQYSTASVVACSEVTKLLVSSALLLNLDGSTALRSAITGLAREGAKLALPSVLYTVQNNLLFHAVRMLDPMVYIVWSQCKVLWSAFFGVLLLRAHITCRQVGSLFLLVYGMILVQSQQEFKSDVPVVEYEDSSRVGILCVVTAGLTSGFAGAYLERIYTVYTQDTQPYSVWFRNVQLAIFSVPLALLLLFIEARRELVIRHPFTGFDSVVIGIIALQAVGGLIIAAVMRYATNVLKCFAVSLSICNCAFISSFIIHREGQVLSRNQFAGIVIVIISTFMHGTR